MGLVLGKHHYCTKHTTQLPSEILPKLFFLLETKLARVTLSKRCSRGRFRVALVHTTSTESQTMFVRSPGSVHRRAIVTLATICCAVAIKLFKVVCLQGKKHPLFVP